MKTVFTDISKVAHLWANQEQETARNSGNYFFRKETIFSYGSHFPIAKHILNDKGEKAVLFTERTYSNTTSKHISVTRQAINHLNLVYCFNPESSHSENFNYWANEIESISKNLVNARKPEIYLNKIEYVISKAQKYSSFFSIEIPKRLSSLMSITSKEEWQTYSKQKAEAQKAEQIKRENKIKRENALQLKKWRNNETQRIYSRNGFDFLRLNLNEQRIETSQGVQIPVEIGVRFWAVIQRTIKNGGCINCGLPLLNYTVKTINKDFIEVGCHKIEFKELKAMATQLNLV